MKLDVVGMLYRGYFYYAYLVGPYAPPQYGVSTTSSRGGLAVELGPGRFCGEGARNERRNREKNLQGTYLEKFSETHTLDRSRNDMKWFLYELHVAIYFLK